MLTLLDVGCADEDLRSLAEILTEFEAITQINTAAIQAETEVFNRWLAAFRRWHTLQRQGTLNRDR